MNIRIVQSILGGFIAVLIALIGRRIGGVAVGIVAGVLWAIYPMGTFVTGIAYSAVLITLIMASAVLCLLTDTETYGYRARIGLAGLLFGVGTLTKPIVFGTIVFVSFWIFLQKRTDRILLVCIFLLSALVALLPWTIHNLYTHERLVPIESRALNSVVPWASAPKPQNRKAAADTQIKPVTTQTPDHTQKAAPAQQERPAVIEAADQNQKALPTKNDPPATTETVERNDLLGMFTRMAKRYPTEFFHFFEMYPQRVGFLTAKKRDRAHDKMSNRFIRRIPFGSDLVMAVSVVSVGGLYASALIGIGTMWWRRDKRRELLLLVLLVMSFALGYAISWGKIRYRIPVDPYIIILSAWGIVFAWNKVFRKQLGAVPVQGTE